MNKRSLLFDVEANSLLNYLSIDYSKTPYKLKKSFKVHCIVLEDINTQEIFVFDDNPSLYIFDGREHSCLIPEEIRQKKRIRDTHQTIRNYPSLDYIHKSLSEFPTFISEECGQLIGHNIIDYDMLVMELYFGKSMEYNFSPDSIGGKRISIHDTLVLSKLLNPDRFGGHSLDNVSGGMKFEYLGGFTTYNPVMLYYCIQDVKSNRVAYYHLKKEWGDDKENKKLGIDWSKAYSLEKYVRNRISRNGHYGFKFDKKLAQWCVEDLDNKKQEIEEKVEPLLPPKPITKTLAKEYTPPAKQFKVDGSLSNHMENFLQKVNAKILEADTELVGKRVVKEIIKPRKVKIGDSVLSLPLEQNVPVFKEEPMLLKHQADMKKYLISAIGWEPTTWKDKDITIDTAKRKLTKEKYQETVERYVEETLGTPLEKYRCEHLKCKPEELKKRLLTHDMSRPLKVYTQPSYTKNQDKDLCDNLVSLGQKVEWVQDVVNWLTYKQRRNVILSENGTGWFADPRIDVDGRISTPADTLGCSTSRFRHIGVANVPRVSSLYGEHMRALFGVEENEYQIGYDADGLESRIEAHYCINKAKKDLERAKKRNYKVAFFEKRLKEAEEYAVNLVAPKPNDIHQQTADRLTQYGVDRTGAKSVRYACLPAENTEILTTKGWRLFGEIKVGDEILSYNPITDRIEKDNILQKHFYENAEVFEFSNNVHKFECTENHRWYGWQIKQINTSRTKNWKFFTAEEINSEHNILCASKFAGGDSNITPDQAGLMGWLLSNGSYKWSNRKEITSSSKGKRKGISCKISQSVNYFVEEIKNILSKNSIRYKEHFDTKKQMYTFTPISSDIRKYLDSVVGDRKSKHETDWVSWVMTLSKEALDEFIYNFWLGDGQVSQREFDKCMIFSQNKGNIAEAVKLAIFLRGKRVTYYDKHKTRKCENIRQLNISHITGQKLVKKQIKNKDVFCITTSNSTFIMRQNGFVSITGNSAYGATPPKIAKMLGIPFKEAEQIFKEFWELCSPLKYLKESVTAFWENVGEREWIIAIDGRKLRTRSKHSLVNTLFQSAGVICMKYAMMWLDKELIKRNLVGDPFRDDLKNRVCTVQMIAYHDECQNMINKALVSLCKKFEDKRKAEEWKIVQEQKGKKYSDIIAKDDRHFIMYSEVGDLMTQSIVEAGKHFNLNIELTAGYILGKNWADCH